MLVLTRKVGEWIDCEWNGEKVAFKIESIKKNSVKVSVNAPRKILIKRGELIDKTLPQAERPATNGNGFSDGSSSVVGVSETLARVDGRERNPGNQPMADSV